MGTLKLPRILLFLAIIIILLLAGIVILADMGRLPGFLMIIYELPMGDKIGHVVLMALLGVALNLIFRLRSIRILAVPVLLGSLAAVALVTVEEISQSFFPARRFSLVDLGCSFLGIVLADMALRYFRQRIHPSA